MVCQSILNFSTEPHYELKCRNILKWFRFIMAVLHLFYFLFLVTFIGPRFFLFISFWAIFITAIYYLLVSLSYKFSILKHSCYLLFEGIFCIDWVITILWFGTIRDKRNYALMLVTHIFPTLTVVIEFILSKIVFQRSHYWSPFGLIIAYVLFVLLPYTLEEELIYVNVNFGNWYTYVILAVLALIIFIVFEVARVIRTRSCRSRNLNEAPKISEEGDSENRSYTK